MLGVISALAGYAGLSLHRAAFPREHEPAAGADTTDWLGDIVALAERGSTRLGPFGSLVLTTARWTDRNLIAAVRRHPVRSATLVAAGFGLTVGITQSLSEGYFASTALASSSSWPAACIRC